MDRVLILLILIFALWMIISFSKKVNQEQIDKGTLFGGHPNEGGTRRT